MEIASALDFLSLNDQAHVPSFLNINDGDDEELQFQLVLDVAFAEELQFEEALKASLFTYNQMQDSLEESGESSLSFCVICMGRKEDDQLISNGEYCGHSFCMDCGSKYMEAKINEGMTSVSCPDFNCEYVLKLCKFKHLISEDAFSQWEKYMEMIPSYSEELHVKTSSEIGNRNGEPLAASETSENPSPSDSEVKTEKLNHSGIGDSTSAPVVRTEIFPKWKQEEATPSIFPKDFFPRNVQSAPGDSFNCQSILSLRRHHERPKPVYSFSKNSPSSTTYSIPCKSSQYKVTEDVKQIVNAASDVDDDYDVGDSGSSSYINKSVSEAGDVKQIVYAAFDVDGGYDIGDSGSSSDTNNYDSETSPRSSEICRKSKWFKTLVDELDCLSMEEIKDPAKQWQCSACQGSGGAFRRYLGVQVLIQHAKTKGSTRVRHRQLAQLLEEKLKNDQTNSATQDREACAKWVGLKEENNDYEIVWPPMVVITNTIHKKDESNKWIGMTSQELLDLFGSYDAIVKARHSYNWNGHGGTSILIFESSAKGYLEAERLHKHFEEQGTGRNAWNTQPIIFLPGGKRQLYGYMAMKEDLDTFSNKSKSKPKLKYEMRSYQETVVNRIRRMSEDNYQLQWLKNRVAEQQKQAKDLEEFNDVLKEKLQKATKEMGILRSKANQQHQQSLEELIFQEQFYQDRITHILEARQEKDENLENGNEVNKEQENEDSSNRKS